MAQAKTKRNFDVLNVDTEVEYCGKIRLFRLFAGFLRTLCSLLGDFVIINVNCGFKMF